MVKEELVMDNLSNNDQKIYYQIASADTFSYVSDVWITDPPYEDSVRYHELTDFFYAWDKKWLDDIVPYDINLDKSICRDNLDDTVIDCYSNITKNMSDDGYHVIMYAMKDKKREDHFINLINKAGLNVIKVYRVRTENDISHLKNGSFELYTSLYVCRKKDFHPHNKSLIEFWFPEEEIGYECLKEKMSGSGQILTTLGKWWGRKPLVLVRSLLLSILIKTNEDKLEDSKKLFMKLMTMDNNGLLIRKDKSVDVNDIIKVLNDDEKIRYIDINKKQLKTTLTKEEKNELQMLAFQRLPYEAKLKYCKRPEEVRIDDINEWAEISKLIGSSVSNLKEAIYALSINKFGRIITVGDCFCGGGSIPFEAARLGLNVYASDLNPIAMLLTSTALQLLMADDDVIKELECFMDDIINTVDRIITELGLEHNEQGHRAQAYIYCLETKCPSCGYKIPLAPNWIISVKHKTIAKLIRNDENKNYDIDIVSGVTNKELDEAKNGTVKNSSLYCLNCGYSEKMSVIRGDKVINGKTVYGLRQWEKYDFVPRPDDVFQERLYCIKYKDHEGNSYYTKPSQLDLLKEQAIIDLLSASIKDLIDAGIIPDMFINEGKNTSQLKREKGFNYWFQLFNHRQLLLLSTIIIALVVNQDVDLEKKKLLEILMENNYIPEDEIKKGKKTEELFRTRVYTHWHHLFSHRQLCNNALFMIIADIMLKNYNDIADKRVIELLMQQGFISNLELKDGKEIDRLRRERGYTHWHHLFNHRQLCNNALFMMIANLLLDEKDNTEKT